MEPLSPRALPSQIDVPSAGLARARALESVAAQFLEDVEHASFEACMREAYNTWLTFKSKDSDKCAAIRQILHKLALFHKEHGSPESGLRYVQICFAMDEEMTRKHGTLGDAETLVLLSEFYNLCRGPEEAMEVAKRAIDLLFRRSSNCGDIKKTLARDQLALFGHAWQCLATAEEFMISRSDTEDEKSARAVEVLVHYRRGAKCGRELLGPDDVITSALERRYAAAKKVLGKLAALAPKDQMPPVVAAYPGDPSAPAVVEEKPPLPRLEVAPSGAEKSPNVRRQSSLMPSKTPSEIAREARRELSLGSAVCQPSISPRHPTSSSVSPRTASTSSVISKPSVAPTQRRTTVTRLDPLIDSPSVKRSESVAAVVASPSPRAPKIPSALLTSTVKRGLQILFFTAESRKRLFVALRSVYFFTRDCHTSFPHFNLNGQKTLTEGIKAQDHRLDAMEFGQDHTRIEADVAQRIRRRKSIDELKNKKKLQEEVVLFADMDKRTERSARRFKLMMQSVQSFLQNVDRFALRRYFQKWLLFLAPRRRMRPLRRAAAHLFKQIDRQHLRRRFIVWLRWLKDRKRSVFALSKKRSTAQTEAVQRTLRLIQEQETENEVTRDREKRRQEEDATFARHKAELEKMQAQIMEAIAQDELSTTPVEEPPKVAILEFLRDAVHTVLAGIDQAAGDLAAADAAKLQFSNDLRAYADSEDFAKEVRRLPPDDASRSLNTDALLPLMINLVEDESLFSEQSVTTCRDVMKSLHPWVDFHRIFFENDVLLSAARSGHHEIVEVLLDGVPGFTVSSEGSYIADLLTVCAKHETKSVPLMEVVLMKCEGCIPFHEAPQVVTSLIFAFFDRWVPSTVRSLGRRGTLYSDPTQETSVRTRCMTLFERVLLDVRSFKFPHDREFSDKQTLFSRMCANGDLELVELYCSLLDSGTTRTLLLRTQSDGTNALVQAVKSRSTLLVRYLVTEHEDTVRQQLLSNYDGSSLIEIAKLRGCGEDMLALLRENGVRDPDIRPDSAASHASSESNAKLKLYDDTSSVAAGEDIDDLFDDNDRASNSDRLSFSSPHPPESHNASFRRL